MTETELQNEAEKLATASREQLAAMHHEKYPADRNSVKGVYNPTKSRLLADLIVDLATRFGKE